METNNALHRFSEREQTALRSIIDKIIAYADPLTIYCVTTVSTCVTEYSCFTSKNKTEEWTFECDLLIVLPDDRVIDDGLKQHVELLTSVYGKVTALVHPLGYVKQQMKEGSPFFCRVDSDGVVLHERGGKL